MDNHRIVSPEEWLIARKHHLLRRDERFGPIKRPTHAISDPPILPMPDAYSWSCGTSLFLYPTQLRETLQSSGLAVLEPRIL